MALTKTPQEIEILREGGALLSRALKAAVDAVRPGVEIRELDLIAEKVIIEGGGEPSFKGYQNHPEDPLFPSTVCVSINDEIVHGLGNRPTVLKEGDIVGLDVGCWYKGLCTDMSVTVPVGRVSDEIKKLLEVTKEALEKGIEAAKVGGVISDISAAIENYAKPYGFGIIRSLVGHGVGHKVHEAPHIPNFISPNQPRIEIQNGMVLALEPMFALGDWQVETADDGWAVVMKDGGVGAHFEVTIAVTNNRTEILTPSPLV